MKKILKWLGLCIAACMTLCSAAFADVAAGPMYAVIFGIPALIIAVIVIVLVLIIRHILKKKD